MKRKLLAIIILALLIPAVSLAYISNRKVKLTLPPKALQFSSQHPQSNKILPIQNPETKPLGRAEEQFIYPLSPQGVPILMYHSISNIPGNNLGVPPEKFAQQMKYLYDSGFVTISLDNFYEAYSGKAKLPKKPVVITFDDGYQDNFTTAFPILKQYNFIATFFVVTSYVNSPGMLSWDELREMSAYGMSIESHTVSHLDLRTLSRMQQWEQLAESKSVIENAIGKPVYYFCYPSGKYNPTTLEILGQLGYKAAVTTAYGKAKPRDPLLQLKRIRVNGNSSLAFFAKQL